MRVTGPRSSPRALLPAYPSRPLLLRPQAAVAWSSLDVTHVVFMSIPVVCGRPIMSHSLPACVGWAELFTGDAESHVVATASAAGKAGASVDLPTDRPRHAGRQRQPGVGHQQQQPGRGGGEAFDGGGARVFVQ